MTYICPHMTLSANLLKTVMILFFSSYYVNWILVKSQCDVWGLVESFITVPFDNNSQWYQEEKIMSCGDILTEHPGVHLADIYKLNS